MLHDDSNHNDYDYADVIDVAQIILTDTDVSVEVTPRMHPFTNHRGPLITNTSDIMPEKLVIM